MMPNMFSKPVGICGWNLTRLKKSDEKLDKFERNFFEKDEHYTRSFYTLILQELYHTNHFAIKLSERCLSLLFTRRDALERAL